MPWPSFPRNFFRLAFAALLSLVPLAAGPVLGSGIAQPVDAATPEDREIVRTIAPYSAQIHEAFDQIIATAPQGLRRGPVGEDNPLGCWVTDVMRMQASRRSQAPVAFAITNRGGLRADLPVGSVKRAHIFEIAPFENALVTAELTGAEIIQVLKESILRRGGEPCSGVRAELSGNIEKQSLRVIWSDGTEIEPERTFRIVTTDYLMGGGDSIPTLRKGRNVVPLGISLRDALLETCQELSRTKQPILPPAGWRYHLPADLLKAFRNQSSPASRQP